MHHVLGTTTNVQQPRRETNKHSRFRVKIKLNPAMKLLATRWSLMTIQGKGNQSLVRISATEKPTWVPVICVFSFLVNPIENSGRFKNAATEKLQATVCD